MKKITRLLFLLFLCSISSLNAQTKETSKDTTIPKRQYFTKKLSSEIKLDGIPDEAAWDAVEWSGDFTQFQPNEKTPPSQQTRFKIIYDDKFIYFAAQCLDAHPDSIVRRLGRRDEFPGDWISFNIDSYHDLRTAFSFTLSVSGVRNDEFISGNGDNFDDSWNPIWFGKTHSDAQGWTAEMKIPFSQLRFGNEPDKVWGFQVMRKLFRKEERSIWQVIPRSYAGWVSGFGEIHGLKDIKSQKQIEIAPYVVAQTQRYKKTEGNPFATGTDSKINVGVDGKVAITSDMILDFTINPDFGQVEADPSQVRIDGFQSFFSEKRPFFIESRNLFDYQVTGSQAGGNYDSDLLFYSRRIGSSPHGSPNLANNEFVNIPDNTAILGAAKFSGKTKTGWSIGVLESVTQQVNAEIDNNGIRRKELVEPLTSYFVGRTLKDFDKGNTVLGLIFTAVNREKGLSDVLNHSAFSGGIDFQHNWNNKAWFYRGNIIFSHLDGSPQSIYNTQTGFEHLFQRPGNTEGKLDNTLTSLTGTGGTFRFGKSGGKQNKKGGLFQGETGFTWRSPQLELNDIGFMQTADEINHFTWVSYVFQKPFSIFNNWRLNYNHWGRWDFAGKPLYQAVNINSNALFKNNWNGGMGATINTLEISNNALRGGAALRRPEGMGVWIFTQGDRRKKVYLNLYAEHDYGFENTVKADNINLGVTIQPLNNFNINIGTGYSYYWRRQDQFVSNVNVNNLTRSIVSEVSQKTLNFTLRLNYNITPELSIQYYGQPFITRPVYQNFGYVVDPLNTSYDNRFHTFTANEIHFDGSNYIVNETGDSKNSYTFSKPDFNFVQFRSNLILRWEYRSGSEFYLVWSQSNTPDVNSDLTSPVGKSLFSNIYNDGAKNIALVKWTYRFLK